MSDRLDTIYSKLGSLENFCNDAPEIRPEMLSTDTFDEFWNHDFYKVAACAINQIDKRFAPDIQTDASHAIIDRVTNTLFSEADTHLPRNSIIHVRSTDKRSSIPISEQAASLINEAYIGIEYLNDMKAYCASFKYMFNIFVCGRSPGGAGIFHDICKYDHGGQSPHLVEENMGDLISLSSVLENIGSKNQTDAILVQLLTAVTYAANNDVFNLPFEIVVRFCETKAQVPVILNGETVYLDTLGTVPVISRYHTCVTPEYPGNSGFNYTAMTEQTRFIDEFFTLLKRVNPSLYSSYGEHPGHLDLSLFGEIISFTGSHVLNCKLGKCTAVSELADLVTEPRTRMVVRIQSLVHRINKILTNYPRYTHAKQYIAVIFVIKYSAMAIELADKMTEVETQAYFFSGREMNARSIPNLRKRDRDSREEFVMTIDDLEFIKRAKEACLSLQFEDLDEDELVRHTSQAIQEVEAIATDLHSKSTAVLSTRDGIMYTMDRLIFAARAIFYFSSLNCYLELYKKHYYRHQVIFTTHLADARRLYETITSIISKHLLLNQHANFSRIYDGLDGIDSIETLELVEIYGMLVEPLSRDVTREVANYKQDMSDELYTMYTHDIEKRMMMVADVLDILQGDIKKKKKEKKRFGFF